jgi:hypothetical protein
LLLPPDESVLDLAMPGKPVIPPPAELAANGPQRKHAEKFIEGTQFRGFEFY